LKIGIAYIGKPIVKFVHSVGLRSSLPAITNTYALVTLGAFVFGALGAIAAWLTAEFLGRPIRRFFPICRR
jgi:hypothetical protein